MKKIWVVVANASISRIYEAKDTNTLIELRCMEHFQSHATNHALVSDKGGKINQRFGYGVHVMEDRMSPKKREKVHFAAQLADYLLEAHHHHKFEKLYLIANIEFLSMLNEELDPSIAKLVAQEVQKDLTHLPIAEAREYLPPVL